MFFVGFVYLPRWKWQLLAWKCGTDFLFGVAFLNNTINSNLYDVILENNDKLGSRLDNMREKEIISYVYCTLIR